jgi:AmmeMemoRadiSam system protein A
MQSLAEQDRRALLALARSAIAAQLFSDVQPQRPQLPSSVLLQPRGCFVTLHKHGNLRGCIGTIEAKRSLVELVEENACNAAFRDPRFSPLMAAELDQIDIEISVLTPPAELDYQGPQDLIAKLRPGIDGVILSKEWYGATFLPQVWEQLPRPEAFLDHLCRKAGLSGDCWKKADIVIKTYQAEYFSE